MLLSMAAALSSAQTPPYLNPKLSVEARVRDLLGRMTVAEKIAQLRCDGRESVYGPALKTTGFGEIAPVLRGITPRQAALEANRIQEMALQGRLKIPTIIHDEALHGLVGNGATSFPQAIGLASTWNPALVSQVAKAIALETKSRGIRHVLSPVINVVRDARWGRVEETYGEDPLLNTVLGVEFIRAFEQNGVVTTPKHYVANVWDGGRDSHSVNVSERQLREVYLPPFEAAFKEAGARSVMAAYGSLNGYACSASKWLLTDLLRKEYGFKGFVVSDYGSVGGILWAHRTAANAKEAAAQAVNAGMDMELPDVNIFGAGLEQAVRDRLISPKVLDEAVSRVLRVKFELGLFENAMVDVDATARINEAPAHQALALEAARQSLVLLKNDRGTLPLDPKLGKVALIGPNANRALLGGYSGSPTKVVSVLDALRARLGEDRVVFAQGCEIGGRQTLPAVPSAALRTSTDGRAEQGLEAEYFDNANFAGQPKLRRIDRQVDFDWGQGKPHDELSDNDFSVRWKGYLVPSRSGLHKIALTSDDGARMYLDGKLVAQNWGEHAATTVDVTVPLEAGKPVAIQVEYFEAKGFASCRLGWLQPGDEAANPAFAEAVRAAEASDAVVFVAGILEGEGRDRAFLDLPGQQEELIQALAATGKPMVVVLMAGAPVTMEAWVDRVPAILCAWYAGQSGGTAIVEALLGDVNPSGKLPMTFPRSVGQCPIYYNLEPSGRGYDYVDSTGQPRYAFGHGLSYTEFRYENLRLREGGPGGAALEASFDLSNVGKVAGAEVAQLYVRDVVASQVRPLKELKAFKRVELQPGEMKRVVLTLSKRDLSFWGAEGKWIFEPGKFEVMVGGSSDVAPLRGEIDLK